MTNLQEPPWRTIGPATAPPCHQGHSPLLSTTFTPVACNLLQRTYDESVRSHHFRKTAAPYDWTAGSSRNLHSPSAVETRNYDYPTPRYDYPLLREPTRNDYPVEPSPRTPEPWAQEPGAPGRCTALERCVSPSLTARQEDETEGEVVEVEAAGFQEPD